METATYDLGGYPRFRLVVGKMIVVMASLAEAYARPPTEHLANIEGG